MKNNMENNQENKFMETENVKDIEVNLEEIGDNVVGGLVPRDVASRAAKER